MLTGHHAFRPHTTPVQLLNKATDPFLPGVRPHLFRVLHALDQRGYTNHILVITRFKVTGADMDELESLRHLRVTLLFTYSGITDPRVEPIAKSRITMASILTACAGKQRTGVVLYWRPIVPGWNDHPDTMAHVLDTGRHADAIVFTGYYHKPENAAYLREQGVALPYGEQDYHRRKAMPAELDATVIAAWRASGISTPLFRKTSCGAQFGYQTRYLIEDGHIWTHGLGEQRRYAIQHTLRYQIWELDQPHYLYAHGHAPHGHATDPAQAEHVTVLRDQLTAQTRYTDDD
jgi:hypothetical protein